MFRKLLVLLMVLGFVGSVQAALVHEWELDGNTNDTSGSGNHGTVTGTASYVDGVDYWKTSSGQAFYLNGSTRIEDLAASNLPLQSTGVYSIRCPHYSENVYVTLEGNSGLDWKNAAGFGQYASGDGRFMVTRYANVYLSVYGNDVGTGAYIPTDGTWHMITATHWQNSASPVRGNTTVYYDGVYANAGIGMTPSNTVPKIQAGYYTRSGANYWVGKIDGFQIYDHTLNQTEIDTLYERIPEPATIALLGLGGLVLLRRKR
jgi:hypothetical protein